MRSNCADTINDRDEMEDQASGPLLLTSDLESRSRAFNTGEAWRASNAARNQATVSVQHRNEPDERSHLIRTP